MKTRSLFPSLSLLVVAALAAGVVGGCKSAEENAGKKPEGEPGKPAAESTSLYGRPAPKAEGVVAKEGEILIGLVAAQSGDQQPWGADSVDAAQLAVDEFNAAGGVNGRKVKLVVQDSASKPEQGKNAAEKLVNQGVIGIVGEVASGTTMQVANVAFEKNIPVVAIGATKVELTDRGTNVFRVCYVDDFQGKVMAKFAFDDLKLRKIAILTDKKAPYSKGLSDNFRAMFGQLKDDKGQGEIVTEEFYQSGETQFNGQLTNIKAKNPDGLFLSGYFTEVGPIVRQAKQMGLNVAFLGGDGWDSSQLLQSGGDAIIGGFFCNHCNNDEDRPEVKSFLQKWAKKYNGKVPATAMGPLGYDATAVMLDALKRAKAMDSKSLLDAIEDTVDFKGVTGGITLKGMKGNPPKRALVLEVTKNGFKFKQAYDYDKVMK